MYKVYYNTLTTGDATAIIEESNLREFIYVIISGNGAISKIVKL